jgi:tetratricopeptide (TPR) repeat protein
MSRLEYLFTEFSVITTYVRLLFLPVGQNLDYDYPLYGSFFEMPVLLSFVFLVFMFGLGIYMLRRSGKGETALRLVSFGIFWYFLTLSVESSIIPIVDVIFEHRLYLPSVGAIAAVVSGAFLTVQGLKSVGAKRAALGASVVVVLLLSGAAYARNNVWRSEISLWEDVVRKSPLKARAYNNLGNLYNQSGMHDKAIQQQQKALDLKPDFAEAYNNLGNAYDRSGMHDKAIQQYQKALDLKPDFAEAYSNLGNAYFFKGMIEKAIESFETALRLDPELTEAHNNLGNAFISKGMTDRAIEHFETTLRLNPDSVKAHFDLGNAYLSKGMTDVAMEHFEIVLRLKPDHARAHYRLGNAYLSKGMADKAIEHYETALRLRSDDSIRTCWRRILTSAIPICLKA